MFFKMIVLGSLLCIGLYAGSQSLMGLYYLNTASSWPAVMGTIDEVTTNATSGSPGTASPGATSARVVDYTYSVNGQVYSNNREYFGLLVATNNETRGGYRPGTSVDVYYHPEKPEKSVLKPSETRGVVLSAIAGVLFTLFGGGGILHLSKQRNSL